MIYKIASFDNIVSNLIVCAAYLFTILLWFYCFNNFEVQKKILLFNFPYGILVLAFLFFGNKIILGLLFSQVFLYFVILNDDFSLLFKNHLIISLIQLASMPITLYVLERFNYTVGIGVNYKLNKTNIYHVLLITFISTIVLGTLIFLSSIFFENHINLLPFVTGNFFGGGILILGIKLVVNLPPIIKSHLKTN